MDGWMIGGDLDSLVQIPSSVMRRVLHRWIDGPC